MVKQVSKDGGDDEHFIYRASITLRNGRKLYAYQRGLKAFKIRIKKKSSPEPKDDSDPQ